MITELERDEQYISVLIKDGTATNIVITYLEEQYPVTARHIEDVDSEEILILMPECGKGLDCSMKELKRGINGIAAAEITMFRVSDKGERIRMI